jgi:hypothetical protein
LTIGTGIGSIIDFHEGNSGFILPFQLGIRTEKDISRNGYLTFGFSVTKRGNRYRDYYEYQDNHSGTMVTHHIFTNESLRLYYLDVPISYYRSVDWLEGKYNPYFYVGLNNSLLLKVRNNTNPVLHSEEKYFRDYNTSFFTGIELQQNSNIHLNLTLNHSLLSVIKPEYQDEILDNGDNMGVRVYPVELILSCLYIIGR